MGFTKFVRELADKNKPKPIEEQSETSTEAAVVSTGPGVMGSADDCFIAIQNAAGFLQTESQINPFPYRLMRMLKWEPIESPPPSAGGKTMVPAPYSATLEAFRNLFQEQAWPDLAKNGEDAFSADGMLFWFDLQRFICTALVGLGPEYAQASKAIRIELALLLSRCPSLMDLAFDDSTPFADAMTKEWIQTEVFPVLGGSGGGGPAPIKKKGDVGEEQKQAATLLGEGKLDQALNVLRTGVANDSNEKNNFDRKLIMAELCYKSNKMNISKALIEDLLVAIEQYALVRWDTELCVSVYALSQKVYLALSESADEGLKHIFREKALAVHAQISKLDPVLALVTDIK
jgi:type VI secretion system protein VasJ